MKSLPFLTLLFWAGSLTASEPKSVHVHTFYIEGVLPSPYNTMSLEIELNAETDDVEVFELFRGKERINIPTEILSKLKDVELSSIEISHEMYRLDESSRGFSEGGDWLYITFDLGDQYRVKRELNGVSDYKWANDSAELVIVNDSPVMLKLVDFAETGGGWERISR